MRNLSTRQLPSPGLLLPLLLIGGLARPALAQTPATFGTSTATSVGANTMPLYLAVADVNADGKPDVFTANNTNYTVGVLLGNGTGGFTLSSSPSAGAFSAPYMVTVADVNGDSKPDLLTANKGSVTVGVLLGTGTGTFGTAATYSSGSTYSDIRSLAVGDMNGDGRPDVVGGNYGLSTVGVLLGNGSGAFTLSTTTSTGNSNGPVDVAVADVNGDGRRDVLTANYDDNTMSVLLGNGSGGLTLQASTPSTGPNSSPRHLVVADVNGDGRADVLTANGTSSTVGVLLGNGNGTFQAVTTYTTGTSTNPYDLAVADMNGDGVLDVVTCNFTTNTIGVLLGNGTGGFALQAGAPSLGAGSFPFGIVAADVNGDGRPDVLTANGGNNTVGVVLNTTPPNLVISSSGQSVAAGTYNTITVSTGGSATLAGNVTVNTSTTVSNGATLNDGCFVLDGAGSFTLAAGGTLGICGAQGIALNSSSLAASGAGGRSSDPAVTVATGSIQNTGSRTFDPDASYVYNGTTAQTTGTGLPAQVRNLTTTNPNAVTLTAPTSFTRVLTVGGAGNLVLNGQALTLLSSAAGTGLVVNSGTGTVSGNTMVVQRYLDPSLNAGLGYRHYSSPVTSTTVNDLTTTTFSPVVNPLYNTQGSTVSNFPTVFGYDESRVNSATATTRSFDQGYFSPNALTDALVRGRGYTVNIDAASKVDMVGTPNTGTVAVGALSRGTETNSGWHLLGNPYPAPLDWNVARLSLPTGVVDAAYVFKSSGRYAGTYQVYQNGFGTLPGGLIGSMQGFFIRVSQSVPSFSFQNAWRVTTYNNPTFNRTTTDTRPAVQLELEDAQGTRDAAFVYFEQGATVGMDDHYDAVKLPNTTGLNLASLVGLEQAAINGLPPLGTAPVTVPLAVGVPVAGRYTLAAAQLLNLSTTPVYLRDLQSGAVVDLHAQPSYAFTVGNATALITGRFELVFSPLAVLATAPAALAAQVGLYPNPATATAFVELPAALGRAAVSAALTDALGRVVRTQALPAQGATAHRLALAGLAPGVYTLHLRTSAGVIAKKLVVQ